jgi:hypothetical protein
LEVLKMEKACPLCGSTKWNYDIIILGLPEKFCGDCWHDIKAEALKIGYNVIQGMPKSVYNKALRLAKNNL